MTKQYNKIIDKTGKTYIDLTQDTVDSYCVLTGHSFHLPNGSISQGSLFANTESNEFIAILTDSNNDSIMDNSNKEFFVSVFL